MKPSFGGYYLKSRLWREEILRWSFIFCLFVWAIVASVIALRQTHETVLIAISDSGTFVIREDEAKSSQSELTRFIQAFIQSYYQFDETSYAAQMSRAGDFMNASLWFSKREEFVKLGAKLKTTPLIQAATVRSIDQLDEEKIEAVIDVSVTQRLETRKATLKVSFGIGPHKRSAANPWPFEITEVRDASL